jgi:hypothetical protein
MPTRVLVTTGALGITFDRVALERADHVGKVMLTV